MIEREVEATILILAKSRASFGALASSVQTVQVKLPDVNLVAGEDQEVGSLWPLKKEGGLCRLPDPTTFDYMLKEDPF